MIKKTLGGLSVVVLSVGVIAFGGVVAQADTGDGSVAAPTPTSSASAEALQPAASTETPTPTPTSTPTPSSAPTGEPSGDPTTPAAEPSSGAQAAAPAAGVPSAAAADADPSDDVPVPSILTPTTGQTVVGQQAWSGAVDSALIIRFEGRNGIDNDFVELQATNVATGEVYVAPDRNHAGGGLAGPPEIDWYPVGYWEGSLQVPAGTWSVVAILHDRVAGGTTVPSQPSAPVVITVEQPDGFIPVPTITSPAKGDTVVGTTGTTPGFVTVPVSGTGLPGYNVRVHADAQDPFVTWSYGLGGESLPSKFYWFGGQQLDSRYYPEGPGVVVGPDGTWSTTVQLRPGRSGVAAVQFDPARLPEVTPSWEDYQSSLDAAVYDFTVSDQAVAPAAVATPSADPTAAEAAPVAPAAAAATAPASSAGELAYTGASVALPLGLAGVMLLAGVVLVVLRRRRTPQR